VTGRRPQAETAFQHTVDEALRLRGCVTNHVYPLMTKHGWRTGTTQPGWPDLFAFHPAGWHLLIEVKVPPNRLEDEQLAVLTAGCRAPNAVSWMVTPDDPDWSTLMGWITDPSTAPKVYGFDPHPDPMRLLAEADLRRQRRKTARAVAALRGGRRRVDALPGM
jgi:hypothetical protein